MLAIFRDLHTGHVTRPAVGHRSFKRAPCMNYQLDYSHSWNSSACSRFECELAPVQLRYTSLKMTLPFGRFFLDLCLQRSFAANRKASSADAEDKDAEGF